MIDCSEVSIDFKVPWGSGDITNYTRLRERAEAACNSALLLRSAGYGDRRPLKHEIEMEAEEIAEAIARRNPTPAVNDTLTAAIATTEGAIKVERILTGFDLLVVRDAQRIRNYVTNRLIIESDDPNPKIRLRSLELLGKLSDVGAFTERTEITHRDAKANELEQKLRDKLNRLLTPENVEDARLVEKPLLEE